MVHRELGYDDSQAHMIHKIGQRILLDMYNVRSSMLDVQRHHDSPTAIQSHRAMLRRESRKLHESWLPLNYSRSKWIHATIGSAATNIRCSHASGKHIRVALGLAYCVLVRKLAMKLMCRHLRELHHSVMGLVQFVQPTANGISTNDCTTHADRRGIDLEQQSKYVRRLWLRPQCFDWSDCNELRPDCCTCLRQSSVLCSCWRTTSSRQPNSLWRSDTPTCARNRSRVCNRIYCPHPNWKSLVYIHGSDVLPHFLCTSKFHFLDHMTAYYPTNRVNHIDMADIRVDRNCRNWHRIDRIYRQLRLVYIDIFLRHCTATNASQPDHSRSWYNTHPIACRNSLCNVHNLVHRDFHGSRCNDLRGRSNCTELCRRNICSNIHYNCRLKMVKKEKKWNKSNVARTNCITRNSEINKSTTNVQNRIETWLACLYQKWLRAQQLLLLDNNFRVELCDGTKKVLWPCFEWFFPIFERF